MEPGGGEPNGNVAIFRLRADRSWAHIATEALDEGRAVVHAALAVGNHRLRAEYRGGASHAPSLRTTSHRVVPR
jgi:hypothetical protein